jgi:guanylate kinase
MSDSSPTGKLIVISGPAGCGKDTIVEGLFGRADELNLFYSVSTTTRAIRAGEEEDNHYCFVKRAEFERLLDEGEFLEHTEYCGNFYGTRKKTVMFALREGKNIILKIECEGAGNIKKMFPDAVLIFIMPPSIEELWRRLYKRSTEDEATIERRIKIAESEMQIASQYDYRVVNDDLQTAINDVAGIILSHGQ